MTWSWRAVVVLTVLVGLAGSAAALLGHETADAEGPHRKREVVSCRCVEVKP